MPLLPPSETPGGHQAWLILTVSFPLHPPEPSAVATGALSTVSLSRGHCCTHASLLLQFAEHPASQGGGLTLAWGPAAWG